jgi:hypothetical protein
MRNFILSTAVVVFPVPAGPRKKSLEAMAASIMDNCLAVSMSQAYRKASVLSTGKMGKVQAAQDMPKIRFILDFLRTQIYYGMIHLAKLA